MLERSARRLQLAVSSRRGGRQRQRTGGGDGEEGETSQTKHAP
jgi:hypothetical protein